MRWPGHIEPGTVKNDIFASLDWLPTFVDIAGGPKGNELKAQIEKGEYPGIAKTTLDGVNQRDYLEGKSDKSARDTFFYYSGKDPSAVRYKNWKMYFAMVSDAPAGFIAGSCPTTGRRSSTSSAIRSKRRSASRSRRCSGMGGAIASPSTAYVYDWNMLPIGQQLWLKELETYIDFPPMQDPASYNLEQVMQQVQEMKKPSRSRVIATAGVDDVIRAGGRWPPKSGLIAICNDEASILYAPSKLQTADVKGDAR